MVTIGQELILTENTRVCGGCPLEAVWGTCPTPALSPPGPSRTLESLTQVRGCGVRAELWTEGGKEGWVRIHETAAGKASFLPAQAAPKGSFPLSLIFFTPIGPKVGHHSLCAAEMGSRNVRTCFLHGPCLPSWLCLTSSCSTGERRSVPSPRLLFPLSWGGGCGGRKRGRAVPRKPTRPPAFKASLKTGPARQTACGG